MTGRVAITLPVLSSTVLYPPESTIAMTMPWTSYLVYQHKDILDQDDRMELFERYEVIMGGFIAPQVKLMTGHGTRRFNMAAFNRTMESFASAAREMAAHDQEHQAPCEKTVMMWNHVTNLAREMLSEYPSKQEIEQLRHRCADLYDVRFPRFSSIDRDARQEIDTTVFTLDTVLQQWDLTEAFPLRFYPYKPDRFDRYSI